MFTRVFRGFYVTISLVDLPRIYMLYSGRLFYVQTLHQPVKLLPAKRLASVVSLFRNLDWPIDIVSQFVSVAIDRRRPEETVVVSGKDPNSPSADDLELSMINKPRGAVINTLGDLLLSHPNYKEYIVPALSELVDERNDVICFSQLISNCLLLISFSKCVPAVLLVRLQFDQIFYHAMKRTA